MSPVDTLSFSPHDLRYEPAWCKPQRHRNDDPQYEYSHLARPRLDLRDRTPAEIGRDAADPAKERLRHWIGDDPRHVDEQRAEHRAPVVTRATDDHHHPDQERVVDRLVGTRVEDLLERYQHGAADPHQH